MPENDKRGGIGAGLILSPAEAVTELTALVEETEGGSLPKAAVKAILERVASGDALTERGIGAGILEALKRKYLADGGGIAAAHLWTWLRRGGDSIPLDVVERQLEALEKAGKVTLDRSSGMTQYVWVNPDAPPVEKP